jgi:hypothetical protein
MVFVAILVEDRFEVLAHFERAAHAFCIGACSVTICLVNEFRINPHFGQDCFDIDFVVPGIGFIPPPGIGHHGYGKTQIFLKHLGIGHIERDFSEYIIVVPAVDKTHILAKAPQGAHYKFDGDHLAEIADMDSSGRSYAGGACIAFLLAPCLDNLFGCLVSPMHCLSSVPYLASIIIFANL